MLFEACARKLAAPRTHERDRNPPRWRDRQQLDVGKKSLSLVPHGFKPLLALSIWLSAFAFLSASARL